MTIHDSKLIITKISYMSSRIKLLQKNSSHIFFTILGELFLWFYRFDGTSSSTNNSMNFVTNVLLYDSLFASTAFSWHCHIPLYKHPSIIICFLCFDNFLHSSGLLDIVIFITWLVLLKKNKTDRKKFCGKFHLWEKGKYP